MPGPYDVYSVRRNAQIDEFAESKGAPFDEISSQESSLFANFGSESYNPDCFDDETEILTNEGWKFFAELNRNEKVMTLNQSNFKIEYQKPTAYIDEHYDGKMYSVNSKSIDLLITPNHKLPVVTRKNKSEIKLKTIEEISKLKTPDCIIPKNGIWVGGKINDIIINETEFNANDFIAFIGIYLAEGCCNNYTNRISVSQNNGEKKDKIKNLLLNLNLSFCEHKIGFDINNPDLFDYCNCLGKYAWGKHIPLIIKQLSSDKIQIFLDWFLLGDGTIHKEQRIYYTTSKKLADGIHELILKCGKSGKLNEKKIYNDNYSIINGRAIIGKRPLYEIIEKKSKYCHFYQPNKCKSYIEQTQYSGKIYCVEVPNHIIYVRRNGKSTWSGNSLVGKKGLRIYEKMGKDEQVKASLTFKKYARLSAGWEISPGDPEDSTSVEMTDFIKSNLKSMSGTFYNTLLNILSGMNYGFSISEKVIELIPNGDFKGKIGYKAIKTREPFGYGFKTDIHSNLEAIVFNGGVIASDSKELNNVLPPERFVIFSYNKEFGNWYGESDLRAAYRSWFSKNIIMKFYNIFLERFGAPTVKATMPAGAGTKVKEAIDELLLNLQTKSGIRIPDGVVIELLEAQRRGDAGYKDAINMHDTAISRAILIPELMGFNTRAAGAQSLGEVQFKNFMLILAKLGMDLQEDVVEEQIIRPIIDLNWDNVSEEQYPVFKLNSLEEDDVVARAKILTDLSKEGFVDPTEEWVREYLLLPAPDKDAIIGKREPVSPNPNEPGPTPAKKPEPAPKGTSTPQKPGSQVDGEDIKDVDKKSFELVEKYELHREPTKFEKKVNFKLFVDKLKATDDMLRNDLIDLFTKQRNALLKDVEKNKVVEEQDYRFIAKMQLKEVGKIKTAIQVNLIKIFLDSKLATYEELARAGVPIEIVKKFAIESVPLPPLEPWAPVMPAEAVALFGKKVIAKIVDEDGVKKLLTIAKNQELRFYDSKAFAISGIERDHVLKGAKLALQTGIKQGLASKEIQENLRKIFDVYIPTGEIQKGKLMSPARLETIVRTNVSEAVNMGRSAAMNDPAVARFVPFVQWSSIIDDRVSAYCESMDGRTFKRTDPLLNEPPAHFNALLDGALIETKKGRKKIEDIVIGDLVLTHTGVYHKVYDVMSKFEDKDYYDIELQNGSNIEITGEHPVLTDRGWIQVSELKLSDNIICLEDLNNA